MGNLTKDQISEDKILEDIRTNNVKFIELQFTDINGILKCTTIPAEKAEAAIDDGIWFDGSSVEGFARIFESDMYLLPDLSTYNIIPWKPESEKTARFLCDVHDVSGNPYPGDARVVLKNVLKEAEDMGFTFYTGVELEFFLFKLEDGIKTLPHDVAGYFDYSPRDLASKVRGEIVLALQKYGIDVEMSHHEVAAGQHEIDFKYDTALKTADNTTTFKQTVKSIAHLNGLYATFMPKPIYGISGSGMHSNQSLFTKEGKNAFFDKDGEYFLSDTARHFIAGQLEHIPALTSVLCPTVNSYKRLVSGHEAPIYICWAQINRSALIRVPRFSKGKEKSTRAELRCPDPSCNPYLASAVALAAGLDGIKRKLEPPEAINENVYEFDDSKLKERSIEKLPRSLKEAILESENSELLKKTLGDMYDSYIRSKWLEWDEYAEQVTKWEIDKYLEIL